MENTQSLLLADKNSQWFTVVENTLIGPLSSQDVVNRLKGAELNLSSFLWKEGMKDWQRIFQIKEFHCLFATQPDGNWLQKIQASKKQPATPPPVPAQKEEPRIWYVYMNDTQYGPFAGVELVGLIASGRVHAQTFLWKKGMADWQQAMQIQEWSSNFSGSQSQPAPAAAASKDKRSAPRKPFEARIILTDGREVGWAVCRDISIGGMQVLMDHAPGPVGSTVKINVTGAADIPSFACEGTLVRLLEDGRGFSVRFISLPNDAKQAIEKYIQQ
jgi:hypothetical protein